MTRAQFFRALTWTDWVWKVSKTKSQIFKTHAKINLDSANICHSWFYVKKDWPNCKLVTKILSYKTICYSVNDKVSRYSILLQNLKYNFYYIWHWYRPLVTLPILPMFDKVWIEYTNMHYSIKSWLYKNVIWTDYRLINFVIYSVLRSVRRALR